jgi:hypothetical protein
MMREFLSGQGAKPAVSLPYLTDFTHLLFATVVSCGVWLGIETLKNFDRAVKKLSADKVPRAGPAAVSRIYRRYRQLACNTQNMAVRCDRRLCGLVLRLPAFFGTLRVLVGQQTARCCRTYVRRHGRRDGIRRGLGLAAAGVRFLDAGARHQPAD